LSRRPKRVLLASLPISTAHYPNLALSLLKPAVERLGIGCDVRYHSLDYLERVGADMHDMLSEPRTYMSLVGEWIFAGAAGHETGSDPLEYLTGFFQRSYPDLASAARFMSYLGARAAADEFIEACYRTTDWSAYSIVGFTSSFHQTMASLALARRVKENHPDILIAFGGANCQGDMGIELHRKYEFIDVVCLSEGDLSLPELVRRADAGRSLEGIAGMVVRRNGETIAPAVPTFPVHDMDSLPYPDFSDFYDQHAHSPVAATHYPPVGVFETARGCWWGAKHHCTFCGLNGATMAFRSKSQTRAYKEVTWIADRHGTDLVNTDNILDPRYFQEFLPKLAAQERRLTIYYELKANLRPEQVALLARAGVRKIQPGIETFDTGILALIDKGCSRLQNVQLLKLAAENGIYVEWLALYGFPGEHPEQYDEMAQLLPLLRHLQPPAEFLRARADRFSPYFYRPQDFGVALEPAVPYRFLFPFDDASVRRLAYHFDMRSDQLADVEQYTAAARREYVAWRDHQAESALYCDESDDGVVVVDERWGRPRCEWTLSGAEAAIHRLCWRTRPRHELEKELKGFGPAEIARALVSLCERGLLITEDEKYLALAMRQPGYRAAPSWDEIRTGQVVPVTFAARPRESALS
jgi:ribosomal peptide maturation radical SAM protein 1